MLRTRELPSNYPQCPATFGEHVRKARVDQGLSQAKLARTLGVTWSTVRDWETGRTRPALRLKPRVLAFLAREEDRPEGSIWEQVRWKRERLGLSQAGLQRMLGIHASTLYRGERGANRTTPRVLRVLQGFLRLPNTAHAGGTSTSAHVVAPIPEGRRGRRRP